VRRRRTRPRRSSGPPRERGGLGGGWSVRGHAVMSPWRLAFVSLRWQRVPCLRRVPFAFFPRPVLVSEQARRNDPVNMCGVTGSSAGVRFFHNVAWVCTNHHVYQECSSFPSLPPSEYARSMPSLPSLECERPHAVQHIANPLGRAPLP